MSARLANLLMRTVVLISHNSVIVSVFRFFQSAGSAQNGKLAQPRPGKRDRERDMCTPDAAASPKRQTRPMILRHARIRAETQPLLTQAAPPGTRQQADHWPSWGQEKLRRNLD
ncbi:MAG: hypothetical protein M1825_002932 [Sarcosagium campestre]|nr:MAG: hypothetical protein M1825_002932 [Sarcosagium campestre]